MMVNDVVVAAASVASVYNNKKTQTLFFLMRGNFICCSFFLMPLAVSIDGLMMSLLDGLLASGMVSFIANHAYIFLIGQHSLA